MIKKFSRRASVVAGAAALAFAATAGTAHADVYYWTATLPSGCYGDLYLGGGNYGWGDVSAGNSDCYIAIYSENTSTGGTKLMQDFTVLPGVNATTDGYYFDSGVHKLMVYVRDAAGWASSTGYQN